MRIALFCHSLISDWNHGNAHFLRGVVSELVRRGHSVRTFEARDAWSAQNLVADHGEAALAGTRRVYPLLDIERYDPATFDVERALDGVDLALVHEWSAPVLVARVGRACARRPGLSALFHDTHHRSVTAPHEMAGYDLDGYDGVLAFGEAVRERYLACGWGRRVWTWHEAADPHVFRPPTEEVAKRRDVVFVGNWGDDERAAELEGFLFEPARASGASVTVHGVRYPPGVLRALGERGVAHGGWIPNYAVPGAFARHRVTVHVPRRPYARALPGIPTIRPFEALASGIPLLCAPWEDSEGLFAPGLDYAVARDGAEMARLLRRLLADPARARAMAEHGRRTVLARHTCAHRVDELLAIVSRLCPARSARDSQASSLERIER